MARSKLRRDGCAWLASAGLWTLAFGAARTHADDVHLSGGSVVEGRAVRHADKVTIELESGQITLSADAVTRIDKRESSVERYERRYAALKPDDVAGRLALADYCRDHDMHAREQALLREVLERAPDHAQARRRLGFVKSDTGAWLTEAEHNRARGLVQHDGVWMTPERALALTQLHDQAEARRREGERNAAMLEAQRLALQREQLALEQAREQQARASQNTPLYVSPYPYYGGPGQSAWGAWRDQRRGPSAPTAGRSFNAEPFPISGVRDPRDPSFPLNGVRDPQHFLRTR
ncbi:MAG: hypothetical protein ABW321_26630 [Polyangiales bacterium]